MPDQNAVPRDPAASRRFGRGFAPPPSKVGTGLFRVIRIMVGALGGLFGGGLLALAVCSVPAFFLPGEAAGVLGMVAMFWMAPLGMLAGAIIGGVMAARHRLRHVLVAAAALLVIVPVVAIAAEYRMSPPPPVAANGCRNVMRQAWPGRFSVVFMYERVCPGGARTIDVSVFPPGTSTEPTTPGNALVLDASLDSARHRLFITSAEAPDSILTIAYDSRARVISQQAQVGAIRLRVIPDSVLRAERAPQPMFAAPAAAPTPAPCEIEPRLDDVSPAGVVQIIKRTCPGTPPTIEVSVHTRNGAVRRGDPANALVVDASADSPQNPITIRVLRPTSNEIVFDVDSRARIIFASARVDDARINVTGGRKDR